MSLHHRRLNWLPQNAQQLELHDQDLKPGLCRELVSQKDSLPRSYLMQVVARKTELKQLEIPVVVGRTCGGRNWEVRHSAAVLAEELAAVLGLADSAA
jgi:hypothetical protein